MRLEKIIDPVDTRLLKQELNATTFLKNTRKGGNEIYIVNVHNAPNTIREIGRLREMTFREAGGGTGLPMDLDEFDTHDNCYEQLVLWSPEEQVIIGGYRFVLCKKAITPSEIQLSTAHYFKFTDKFLKEYLPKTIELGRSWIRPEFQPSHNPKKGLYALDNVFDGLGGIIVHYPEIEYFFGKFTMYPSYSKKARNFLLSFLKYYFPDHENLVHPIHPLGVDDELEALFDNFEGIDYRAGYVKLNKEVRSHGEFVPPLVNVYMGLSPTMKTFGTCINRDFGNVEETGIMIRIADINPDKKDRHLN